MKRTAILGAIATAAIAGGNVFIVIRGYHFTTRYCDLGMPPAKYTETLSSGYPDQPNDGWRPGTSYTVYDETDIKAEAEIDRIALTEWAITSEKKGKWSKAITFWTKYRRLYHLTSGYADERLAVCRMAQHGLPATKAHRLLKGLWPVGKKVSQTSSRPQIRALARFDRLLRDTASPRKLSEEFLSEYHANPNGLFADSCLVMAARLLLCSQSLKPTPDDFRQAESELDTLRKRFPTSHLQPRALGLEARIAFLQGGFFRAVELYRRESAAGVPGNEVGSSLVECGELMHRKDLKAEGFLTQYGSFQLAQIGEGSMWLSSTLSQFKASDAKRFWRRLQSDPLLLSHYLDYRLQSTKPTRDLLSLGQTALNRNPFGSLAATSYARLAEAAYQFHRDAMARTFARRALAEAQEKETRDMANFVLASEAKRAGDLVEAIRLYRAIARSPHPTYLAGGALENLPPIYEAKHRLDIALDLYRELGFSFDVAYLLDVKMTPDQVARYASTHSRDRDVKSLRLAAGYRFMRVGRWQEAAREFRGIRRRERLKMLSFAWADHYEDWFVEPDPLVAVYDLARLDRAVKRAHGPRNRAEAKLDLAAYYYKHRDLLLYNPRLWYGERAEAIQNSWNDPHATDEDRTALYRHHWQHECLARAYELYRDVALAFPNTEMGYHAAYQAGCSEEKLSNLNDYWRWVDSRQHLIQHAVNWLSIASKSKDKALVERAAKYSSVFADEHQEPLDSESRDRHYKSTVEANFTEGSTTRFALSDKP